MIRHLVLALLCAGPLVAADAVDRVLALDADGSFFPQELVRAVDGLPAGEQAGALARIGAKRDAAGGEVLRHYLGSPDPALAAAAIRALASAWPTTPADAEAVRARIGSSDAAVAEAACAFAAQVGDDRAIPALIVRFGREAPGGAATRALLALTGHDAGTGSEWNEWWSGREQATAGMIERLRAAIASGDGRRIEDTMIPLLGERRGASDIADLLIQAAEHPDRAIAEAAEAGLSTCPGPVAACWRTTRPERPEDTTAAAQPAAAPVVAAAPMAAPEAGGGLGWLLALAVGGAIGAWMVLRHREHGQPVAIPVPVPVPVLSGTGRQRRKAPRISVTFSR